MRFTGYESVLSLGISFLYVLSLWCFYTRGFYSHNNFFELQIFNCCSRVNKPCGCETIFMLVFLKFDKKFPTVFSVIFLNSLGLFLVRFHVS